MLLRPLAGRAVACGALGLIKLLAGGISRDSGQSRRKRQEDRCVEVPGKHRATSCWTDRACGRRRERLFRQFRQTRAGSQGFGGFVGQVSEAVVRVRAVVGGCEATPRSGGGFAVDSGEPPRKRGVSSPPHSFTLFGLGVHSQVRELVAPFVRFLSRCRTFTGAACSRENPWLREWLVA